MDGLAEPPERHNRYRPPIVKDAEIIPSQIAGRFVQSALDRDWNSDVIDRGLERLSMHERAALPRANDLPELKNQEVTRDLAIDGPDNNSRGGEFVRTLHVS